MTTTTDAAVTHESLLADLDKLGQSIDRVKAERDALLDALTALVDWYGPSADFARMPVKQSMWLKAEAAIAKANGR